MISSNPSNPTSAAIAKAFVRGKVKSVPLEREILIDLPLLRKMEIGDLFQPRHGLQPVSEPVVLVRRQLLGIDKPEAVLLASPGDLPVELQAGKIVVGAQQPLGQLDAQQASLLQPLDPANGARVVQPGADRQHPDIGNEG